jgi:2,3-dihydroxybenzoate decarboxylase
MMILSLNAPAIQAIPDPKKANEIARKANDYLAAEVSKRPDRFRALAALPMQDPELATKELQRCVKELGFLGALVNGYSQLGDRDTALYYDLKQYWPFWAEVEKLDVPFYLHPRIAPPSQQKIYDGHPWMLGPAWGFAPETAVHALRLMASGVFDQHPRLKIVLGHMGEGLTFMMYRIDHCNSWMKTKHDYPGKRQIVEYFNANFWLTTSGHFRTPALLNAMMEIGSDRIMFSTDWPFESIEAAAVWFDAVELSAADRMKIGRTNALKLFKLAAS